MPIRVFSCPASHRPYLVAEIAIAVAEVGRDVQRRERHETTRLDDLVTEEPGRILIIVADEAMGEQLAELLDPSAVRVA